MDNLCGTNWQSEKMKTVEVLAMGLALNAAVVRTLEVGLKRAKLLCEVSVGTDVSICFYTTMRK